ncbi:MAG: hypothetical protein ACNI3A_17290 [Desulfovibrio sp.]|uniref:hypothetical protein n=1 Tax=Desulfovibrio sp. 7SRBS1 TaxID=3378064 RepID=UPI003B3C482B
MRRCAVVVLFVVAAGLALLSGCTHVEPGLGGTSIVDLDQTSVLSAPAWYVHPTDFPKAPLNALFIPLVVTADVANQRLAGNEVMRAVWQTWMGMEVFQGQDFDSTAYYRDARSAVILGRKAGADLVVTGEISYYLPGAQGSDSAISLRLDVYDTRTGKLIWSGSQAGRLEYIMDKDYVVFKRKIRMPDSPMHALVSSIARSLGTPVHAWTHRYLQPVTPEQPRPDSQQEQQVPGHTPPPNASGPDASGPNVSGPNVSGQAPAGTM